MSTRRARVPFTILSTVHIITIQGVVLNATIRTVRGPDRSVRARRRRHINLIKEYRAIEEAKSGRTSGKRVPLLTMPYCLHVIYAGKQEFLRLVRKGK